MPPLHTSNSNLILSYDASDILEEKDRSLFLHKRPLLNADTMIKKGHFKSALEIYYRAVGKIKNPEVQKKIQQNISELHNYFKTTDPNFEQSFSRKHVDTREKEFTESLKELTENLSESLTDKLNILKQIDTIPETDSVRQPLAGAAKGKEDRSEIKPLDLGSLEAKGKAKPETIKEIEPEPEEMEGTLKYEEGSEKEKPKPKKVTIKVQKDNEEETSITVSESLSIEEKTAKEIDEVSSELGKNPKIVDEIKVIKEHKEFTAPASENEAAKEFKTVEEIRVIKEIFESSPPDEPIQKKETNIPTTPKRKSKTEEKEELLLPESSNIPEVETGWSELEKEVPKPKADKDYAPLMKKYEVGNIEIPESTDFIIGEFKSEDSRGIDAVSNAKPGGQSALPKDQTNFSQLPEIGIPEVPAPKISDADKGSQQPYNVPPLPPPLPLNINDWLSNLYFSKEWDRFKPLPLKDRRSGKDRRISTSSQLPKGVKKERRSGHDRRNKNTNLLGEREEFLHDWHKENQNYPQPVQQYGNLASPTDIEFPQQDATDSNLKSIEFLPREPSSREKLPTVDELIKVDLPEPEEILLKPQINQNEVIKEPISSDITDNLSKYVPANEELGLTESDKGLVKIDLPDPVLLKSESAELPHREVSGEIEVSSKDGTGIGSEAANKEKAKDSSGLGPVPYTPEAYEIPEELKIELPNPDDYVRTKSGHLIDPFAPEETPEINMIEGEGPPPEGEEEGPVISEIPELPPPPPEPERTIHGILELKPPEIDDAPFLTLTYDFSKIPHPFKLSKNYSIMEYSYYKYKPMLMKAQEFARRKMLKNALNYYRVIKSQNIPPELKNMINRNITDITEFLEKFIMSKGG